MTTPLAYHLWESTSWEAYLQYYTPENVFSPALLQRLAESEETEEEKSDEEGALLASGGGHLHILKEEEIRDQRSSFAKVIAQYVDAELVTEWRDATERGLKV